MCGPQERHTRSRRVLLTGYHDALGELLSEDAFQAYKGEIGFVDFGFQSARVELLFTRCGVDRKCERAAWADFAKRRAGSHRTCRTRT